MFQLCYPTYQIFSLQELCCSKCWKLGDFCQCAYTLHTVTGKQNPLTPLCHAIRWSLIINIDASAQFMCWDVAQYNRHAGNVSSWDTCYICLIFLVCAKGFPEDMLAKHGMAKAPTNAKYVRSLMTVLYNLILSSQAIHTVHCMCVQKGLNPYSHNETPWPQN